MSKKVYLDSIGCRLNQSEITRLTRQFEAVGYLVVDSPEEADLFVVNTCTVTRNADKDSRKLIRHLHRSRPEADIAATGCYAHMAPKTVKALPGVRYVIDNLQKDNLVARVTDSASEGDADFHLEPLQRNYRPGQGGLTRAFVKVQDGCDNKCTFCITTVARGESRSRPVQEIVQEVRLMSEGGYQEVVLTGVHLGAYGHDWDNQRGLYDLINTLLRETDIPRLRLSSLEPWDITEDFFMLWENTRLCRHLHLPLQSGCDATLKRMLRHTSQDAFRELVRTARERIPNLALSTDLMVGFPGETEDEFQISYDFAADMQFMKIHVFPFSCREGTAAARMPGQVSQYIKKRRVHAIQQLSDTGASAYAQEHVGKAMPVLWEHVRGASEDGFWHTGLTDNYIRVELTHPDMLTNHITLTRFISAENGILKGKVQNHTDILKSNVRQVEQGENLNE